jgi:hypothetical protein
MLSRLVARLRPRRVATFGQLVEFLDRQSAQIAQRSIVGYVHVKTRLPLHELTKERPFADAFEVARWEAYAAILSDLVLVLYSFLLPAASGRSEALRAPLLHLYRHVLSRHPLPAHRQPDGWEDAIKALDGRLAMAALALPESVAKIAEHSAQRLYETLPIHKSLRQPDKPAIVANVQFLIVGLAHEFQRFDADSLATELLSSPDAAA